MEGAEVTFDMLRRALDTFGGRRAHVVGDTIVDTLDLFQHDRRPDQDADHERPVRKKSGPHRGSGVVAKHLRAAGAEVTFSTVLGKDVLRISCSKS